MSVIHEYNQRHTNSVGALVMLAIGVLGVLLYFALVMWLPSIMS